MVISDYYIPDSGIKMKTAVLSDIHDKPIKNALEVLKESNPDLIFIPGDLITGHICFDAWYRDNRVFTDKHGNTYEKQPWKEPENAVKILKELVNIAPVYFSLGNHERFWQKADIDFVKNIGVKVLDNDYERINEGLIIGGLSSLPANEDKRFEGPQYKTNWLSSFENEPGYKILLMHEPQLWQKYVKETNINLTISGHAHGGQWRFLGRGVIAPGQGFFPKVTKGFYFNNRLLVSTGLANTMQIIPRLFNPTELVRMNFNA